MTWPLHERPLQLHEAADVGEPTTSPGIHRAIECFGHHITQSFRCTVSYQGSEKVAWCCQGQAETWTQVCAHLGFLGGTSDKEPTCQCRGREASVRTLGQEDPLEKGLATHSGILAWRIPWTEEPGGLQPMELQSVGHDWSYWARCAHFSALSSHSAAFAGMWVTFAFPDAVRILPSPSVGFTKRLLRALQFIWTVCSFILQVNNRVVHRNFNLCNQPVKVSLVTESTLTKFVYFWHKDDSKNKDCFATEFVKSYEHL